RADGYQPTSIGLGAAVPLLAAVLAGCGMVLAVGGLATLVAVGFAFGVAMPSLQTGVNVAGVGLSTAIAAVVSMIRQRQAERIAELAKLATVAQQAVLRPLAHELGSLSVAGWYVPAPAPAAHTGRVC